MDHRVAAFGAGPVMMRSWTEKDAVATRRYPAAILLITASAGGK